MSHRTSMFRTRMRRHSVMLTLFRVVFGTGLGNQGMSNDDAMNEIETFRRSDEELDEFIETGQVPKLQVPESEVASPDSDDDSGFGGATP
jgi:hypothetical protein